MRKVGRLLEISATAFLLLFVFPLIVLQWVCEQVLLLLDMLGFPEVVTILMRVMAGEGRLRNAYRLLAKQPKRVAAE